MTGTLNTAEGHSGKLLGLLNSRKKLFIPFLLFFLFSFRSLCEKTGVSRPCGGHHFTACARQPTVLHARNSSSDARTLFLSDAATNSTGGGGGTHAPADGSYEEGTLEVREGE